MEGGARWPADHALSRQSRVSRGPGPRRRARDRASLRAPLRPHRSGGDGGLAGRCPGTAARRLARSQSVSKVMAHRASLHSMPDQRLGTGTTPPGSPIDQSSARQRLRILVLLPFTPRLDARHGGRAAAALVARLAERHDVALLCLRPVDGEPVDDMLRGRCELVEEVSLGGSVPWRRPRLLWALARGRPIEVSDSFHPQFAQRTRALARDWRPDVVHLELERMAQYLGALADQPAARVLVAHEPAGANAADLYRASRGIHPVRYLDQRAWRRFEPRALRTLDALVCYTERDRRILAAVAPGVRTTTIPLAADLPEQALDPLGSDPPNVLFVGGFGHPPNVNAAM